LYLKNICIDRCFLNKYNIKAMKNILNLSAGLFYVLIIMAFLAIPDQTEAFSKEIIRGNGNQYSYDYNYRQGHGYTNNYRYETFSSYKSRALNKGFQYDEDNRKNNDYKYNQDYRNKGCYGVYSCPSYNLSGWGYR